MNRRLLLAFAALVLLAATSGCLGLFGSNDVPAERLDSQPPVEGGYAWDSNATVHIEILESTKFTAVYELNQSEIELYRRDGVGGRNPLSVESVRYRYPNGTVINGSEIRNRGGAVQQNRDVTTVVLPNGTSGGHLAFASGGSPKRFSLPTYVQGSYEIVLPPDRSIDAPIIGQANPNGYERLTTDDGRSLLRWQSIGENADTVSVQFFLERDLYVFGGVFALFALIGIGGLLYYRQKIEALREQREEMGLNVDTDGDEFDDDPPPGMR